MTKKIAIYNGRFRPIHLGHMSVIDTMIRDYGEENSLIIIGSCSSPISWRTLFNFSEVKKWIRCLYPTIKILGVPDVPESDDIWFNIMNSAIDCVFPFGSQERIFLGGCTEDVQPIYERGYAIRVIDRTHMPISASNVRQLLLMEEPITKFVHESIAHDVTVTFRQRLKDLDKLRH